MSKESMGSINRLEITKDRCIIGFVKNPLQPNQFHESGPTTMGAMLNVYDGHRILIPARDWKEYVGWWPGLDGFKTSVKGLDYYNVTRLPNITKEVKVEHDVSVSMSSAWGPEWTCPGLKPETVSIGADRITYPVNIKCRSIYTYGGSNVAYISGFYSVVGTVTLTREVPLPLGKPAITPEVEGKRNSVIDQLYKADANMARAAEQIDRKEREAAKKFLDEAWALIGDAEKRLDGDRALFEKYWVYEELANFVTAAKNRAAALESERKKLPVVIPPEERVVADICVQYEAEGDKIYAEVLGEALKAPVIQGDVDKASAEIVGYKRVVVVGAQLVNSLFDEITDETPMQKVSQEDENYIYIQVGKWPPHDVWLVGGWTRVDTGKAVSHIRAYGLPAATMRMKYTVLTPLQEAWKGYFEKPDIVKAVGLLPSAVQNSFSKVFSGYNIITGREEEPSAGDYAGVGLIISGLAIAAAATVYTAITAIPGVGAAGMMKGVAGASVHLEKTKVMEWATKIVQNPFFRLLTGVSFIFMAWWNLTDPMWWQSQWVKMSGDFKKRFEGLRIDVETKLKQAYNLLHISPTAATRAEARSLLKVTKPLINELFHMLSGKEISEEIRVLYPEFEVQVRAFITQFNDLVKLAGGTAEDYLVIEEMLVPIPEIPPVYPEDVVVERVKVMDGDTIEWPDHPEAQNAIRFAGMDAHEVGTTAGKAEAEYLKTLIEGKTITVKINTLEPLDMYGRLLGVPFLEGLNVVHMMLAKFGKEILGTKYKHKFVDWDENTRIAKGEVAPEVPPGVAPPVPVKPVFRINIDSEPSNAKLYIDGVYTRHYTPSNQDELKDVMHLLAPGEHVIKVTKAGKEGSVRVTILEGENPPIMITLAVVGLKVEEPKVIPPEVPVAPPVEVEPFTIYIDSEPTNAKLYIDGVYTRHYTHSDERELKDVMHLLAPGKHIIKATKGGKMAQKEVEILPGRNEPIMLVLEVVGLPKE